MQNLTEIEYLYRDASNYKFRGSFIVLGSLKVEELEPHLVDGIWFNPLLVDASHLLDCSPNSDDHDSHEIEACKSVETGNPICSSDEFVERLRLARGNS